VNKNVSAIKVLYEDAFNSLHLQMQAIIQQKGMSSEAEKTVRAQVNWIHDLAKTLLIVNQIEGARKPPPAAGTQQQSQATQTTQASEGPMTSIPRPPLHGGPKDQPPPSNIPSPGGWTNG
jgi:hypothetical protein